MLTKIAIGTLLLSLTAAQAQFIPDEATKTRALKRAYQIDQSSDKTGQVTADGPAHASAETDYNALDAEADRIDDLQQKWLQLRGDKVFPDEDTCKRHGLRKVTTGNSWRCRK